MKVLFNRSYAGFSQAITARTYSLFKAKMAEEQKSLNADNELTSMFVRKAQKRSQKAFVHPYGDRRSIPMPNNYMETLVIQEVLGPEQVSTHFEHFTASRRYMLFGVGFIGFMSVLNSYNNPGPIINSLIPLVSYTIFIGYPILVYRSFIGISFNKGFFLRVSTMEMLNIETYWSENIEIRVRELMSKAKANINLACDLGKFSNIKQSSLLNFLIFEQIALQNHLHARATAILAEAQNLEKINQSLFIDELTREALNSVDTAYANNKAKIDAQMFDVALEGIAKNRLDYKKDPILPYVLTNIQKTVDKFNSIPKEQQEKMLQLSPNQIGSLRSMDARIRDQFLNAEPKIDPSIKSLPHVVKMLNTWGNKGN